MSKTIGHYARDCCNPTKRVEENVNLVIEEKKKAIILLVYNERMQANENIWILTMVPKITCVEIKANS